jgi:hypothetical protein
LCEQQQQQQQGESKNGLKVAKAKVNRFKIVNINYAK